MQEVSVFPLWLSHRDAPRVGVGFDMRQKEE